MITSEELLTWARRPLLDLGRHANGLREAAFGDRVYFAAQPAPACELVVSSAASPEEIVAELLAGSTAVTVVEPRVVATGGDTTGEGEIRLIALARIVYPASVHIRANWTHLSDAMAQVALRFGADELSGLPPDLDRREIWRVIQEAGRVPYPCDSAYGAVELPQPSARLQVLPD
jgi:hypothetical protein